MKNLFSCLLLILFAQTLNAQSEVSIELELLTPDLIAEAVLDQESFIEWVKLVNEDIQAECSKIKGDNEVLAVLTVHDGKDATVDLYSRPKVKPAILSGIQEKIAAHPSPRTKFNKYSIIINAKINGGSDPEENYTPDLVLPYDKRIADFEALSLIDKQNDIQYWMRKDILPILAYFETIVDPEYAGVLSIGNLVSEGEYLQHSTEKMTDENSDYWRATMEMSKGNQLIPFTKACMLLANGEFDKAKRLLYVIRFFHDKTTLPAKLNGEIADKLNLYFIELGEEIEKGIALHDAEKYEKAMNHYNDLLKDFPKSAWLNYELYFSQSALSGDLDVDGDVWKQAKKTIYECDPMYPINAQAKSGKEGYLLFRRQEINGLFSSSDELRSDFARYADIALDLENYAFAAQIYWLALSHLQPEDYDDRDLLAHYLYCLHKLGDKETIKNFKDDHSEKFKEIEAERLKLMKESLMYKAFSKEE